MELVWIGCVVGVGKGDDFVLCVLNIVIFCEVWVFEWFVEIGYVGLLFE